MNSLPALPAPPALPSLTEAAVRKLASTESYQRGEAYYHDGAVLSLERRGNQLLARVEGSGYQPYGVSLTFDSGGLVEADCSCPYDWGGACKHIVAAALALIHEPEELEERPTVESLVEELDRQHLRKLVLKLVEGRPELADVIESHLLTIKASPAKTATGQEEPPSKGRKRHKPLNPAPFRRQVQNLLHSLDHMRSSEAYWHVGGVVNGLREVLGQAQTFLDAGDGESGLVVLKALTEEYLAGWTWLDGSDGETGEFWYELSQPWAEALLSAGLSAAERKKWATRLAKWQKELDDYGCEEALAPAVEAAKSGWDDPQLQAALRGEIPPGEGAPEQEEDEDPFTFQREDVLTLARMAVLERQGRYDEYLNLAAATGQRERYGAMLVKLGRLEEAKEYGLTSLATPAEVLALAQALREDEQIEAALEVAEQGLELEGPGQASLAEWLRDFAAGAGRPELALETARAAFQESPELANYRAVEALAGEGWPELKARLLEDLWSRVGGGYSEGVDKIEIYLYEGLIDEAVKTAEEEGYLDYETLAQVAEAATASHPDWVFDRCCRQAERIMDAGQSKYYHHALRWLERARAAYRAAGKEAQWSGYLESLLEKHRRKYSLRPGLEELR